MASMAPRDPWPDGAGGARAAGFTLLELVVVLALVGLIAAAGFGGIRLGTRAWETGDRKTEALAETRLAQGLIRRQLAAAYPLTFDDRAAEPQVAFQGVADRVSFIAPVAPHLGRGGLHRLTVDFSRDVTDGEGRLTLRRRLYRPEAPLDGAGEPAAATVLVAGIESATFRYFGASRTGAQATWQETWEDRDALPALVRLDITYADRRRTAWPPLLVAPLIDMDAGCVFEAGGRCRNR